MGRINNRKLVDDQTNSVLINAHRVSNNEIPSSDRPPTAECEQNMAAMFSRRQNGLINWNRFNSQE